MTLNTIHPYIFACFIFFFFKTVDFKGYLRVHLGHQTQFILKKSELCISMIMFDYLSNGDIILHLRAMLLMAWSIDK